MRSPGGGAGMWAFVGSQLTVALVINLARGGAVGWRSVAGVAFLVWGAVLLAAPSTGPSTN
ncbi:MAG TPA: hypothetical protein VK011_03920 [Acidimicrobiia bacterium]|nr:hypothetical protein [Acidimicrobiia bacterium]